MLMKNFTISTLFNQLTAIGKRLAMVLTMLFTVGVGSMWGADVTFTAGTDKGTTTNTSADSMTKSGITISSTSAGLAYDQYRFYNGTITISSSAGNITKIVFTCTSTAYAEVLAESTASTGSLSASSTTVTWTGSSSSFTIKNTAQTRVSKIVVTTAASTYTVTYDKNGATSGSIPTDATKYNSGASVTVKTNSGNLAKTGYTFAGWNTKADGTGTTYTAGTGTFTITANTTLYAKWTANTYTVTWIVDGETKRTDTGVAYNTSKIAPTVSPVPCGGDVIAGWTDAENGNYVHGTSTLHSGATPSITITSDKTFYAVFADYAD